MVSVMLTILFFRFNELALNYIYYHRIRPTFLPIYRQHTFFNYKN